MLHLRTRFFSMPRLHFDQPHSNVCEVWRGMCLVPKQQSATVVCTVVDCVYVYNSSYVQCHMHSAGTSLCGCCVIQSKHSSCLE
jgi:hypothetical protein